jgi:predicted phage terminase large subunit-like protein
LNAARDSFSQHSEILLPPSLESPNPIGLHDFFLQAWDIVNPNLDLDDNWHLVMLCEYLEEVADGRITRLVINIPPRHLKSTLATVIYPCWEWIQKPWLRFLCLSYSGVLANNHSHYRRLLVASDWYQDLTQGRCQLSGIKNRTSEFENVSRGEMIARGLEGTVTGVGGHRIIFDDPNNPGASDPDIGFSKTNPRFSELAKFRDYSITRRDSKEAPVLVIQQRTHEEDVTGFCLKLGTYKSIILPTEAEHDELLVFPRSGQQHQRTKGDLLQPARFDEGSVREAKTTLGSYVWSARHQQHPSPIGGEIVQAKWFQYYDSISATKLESIIVSIDSAQMKGKANDPWAIVVFGIVGNRFYILDIINQRYTFPEGRKVVLQVLADWEPDATLIEAASSGASLYQDLVADQSVRSSFISITPISDKESRFRVAAAVIEAGRLFLPRSADWLVNYQTELTSFPRAAHDDQCDATSQFLIWANRQHNRPNLDSVVIPVPRSRLSDRISKA